MARKGSNPEWPGLLKFIDESYRQKKGRKYPFLGQCVKSLKILTRIFTVPEIMALWSVYLARSPFWGSKTGYLVSGLMQERSLLQDDLEYKKLVAAHEKSLGYREQGELWNSLVGKE